MLVDTIRAFKRSIQSDTPSVSIPVYDKSLNGGKGDRAPPKQWTTVSLPVDIVLIEGWMLGFQSTSDAELTACFSTANRTLWPHDITIDSVRAVNRLLETYTAIWTLLDAIITVHIDQPEWIVAWRQQQERELRVQTGSGMSDDQVVGFVSRFMPCYALFGHRLTNHCPRLAVHLDAQRTYINSNTLQ
jgi:D-glycerate 3-kinase